MPIWAGGVSGRPKNRNKLLSGLSGSLVAAVLSQVLFSISVFIGALRAMLGRPPCFLLSGLTTRLRLVRLVFFVPVRHLVEQKGEGELAEVIAVAHRFRGRFPFSSSFSFGFAPLSLPIACGKLALEGFHKDLEIDAVIHIDFGDAFRGVEGDPHEVGALGFDGVFWPDWREVLVLKNLPQNHHCCSHWGSFDAIPDGDLWREEESAIALGVHLGFLS